MNLTLRKAAKVASMMQEAARDILPNTYISLTEFEDPQTTLDAARERAVKANDERIGLLSAVYHLRDLIGVANATSGISSLMAQGAFLDAQISILQDQANDRYLRKPVDLIKGRLNKIAATDSRYGDEEVSTGVYVADDINVMRQTLQHLRKEKVSVQDSILELNVNTTIDIHDDFKEVLEKFV